MIKRTVFSLAVVCASLLVVGCPAGGGGGMMFFPPGGGGGGWEFPGSALTPSEFQIGGTVTGLSNNSSVTLRLNDDGPEGDVVVNGNGGFRFEKRLTAGADFTVQVVTSVGTSCMASNNYGTVEGGSIMGVKVVCGIKSHALSARVIGLESGNQIVVQNNGADQLTFTTNEEKDFVKPVPSGAAYYVVVKEQPDNQVCNAKGSNTGTMGGAVTVEIECSSTSHSIAGTFSGLVGNGLKARVNNTGEVITLDGSNGQSGSFSFAQEVVDGTNYAVEILQQPRDQTCYIVNGLGVITADIENVSLVCQTNQYKLSGIVEGLEGSEQIIIRLNGSNDLLATATNRWFSWYLMDRTSFSISVVGHPEGKTCGVEKSTGGIAGSNRSDTIINCKPDQYVVSGVVLGLCKGKYIPIQNNSSGNRVNVHASDPFFAFPAQADGSTYNVTVPSGSVPPTVTCTVKSGTGTGTVAGANVTNVVVVCTGCGSCNGDRAMTVSWAPSKSFDVSDLSGGGHGITYRANGMDEGFAIAIDVPNTQSMNTVTIPGLLNGCSYRAQVKAYSALNPGGGQASDEKWISIP